MNSMNQRSAARMASSIFGVYGGLLGFEHGIGEILQGNLAVHTIRINAYGSGGLPFPFGHEPAMTLLPTYLTTGVAASLTALLVMVWSAFFIAKRPGPLVLFILSVLLLFVGGGYGPIPMLILSVIAELEARSSFVVWRRLPVTVRRFVGLTWKGFAAMVFVIVLVSMLWGFAGGLNNPTFSRGTYTSFAMATGLMQVVFALLAILAAAAKDAGSV